MHGFLQPSDRRHLCLVPWQRTRRVRKGLPLGREPLRSLDQSTLQKSMHTERPFVSEKPVDIYVVAMAFIPTLLLSLSLSEVRSLTTWWNESHIMCSHHASKVKA